MRVNLSWSVLANLLVALSQWGLLIIIARLGTPEMLGLYALSVAITAPVISLANLRLRALQSADARGDSPFAEYLGLRILTTAVALGVITTLAIFLSNTTETMLVIIAAGIAKGVDAIADIYHGILQRTERMDRLALIQGLRVPSALVLFALAVYMLDMLALALFALAAVRLAQLAFVDMRYALPAPEVEQRVWPSFQLTRLRALAQRSLPFAAAVFLVAFNLQLPRYFIEYYSSRELLGIYAASEYFYIGGLQCLTAAGMCVLPRLASYFAAGRHDLFVAVLRNVTVAFTAVACAGALVVTFVAPVLLRVLYGEAYAHHSNVLVILAWALVIRIIAGCMQCALRAMNRATLELPVLLGSIVLQTTTCIVALQSFGIKAAAVAVFISACWEALVLTTIAAKTIPGASQNPLKGFFANPLQ